MEAIDKQKHNPSQSKIIFYKMKILSWYNSNCKNIDEYNDLQKENNIPITIYDALLVLEGNKGRYKYAKNTPQFKRFKIFEENENKSLQKFRRVALQVFTHGPENSFLWPALHPFTDFSKWKEYFIASLKSHENLSFFEENEDKEKIFYKQEDSFYSGNLPCSSKWPWDNARCTKFETREMTPWQEITEAIINYRHQQFHVCNLKELISLQDILNKRDEKKLQPWIELEKTLCKHILVITTYDLMPADFAYILSANEDPELSQIESIKDVRNSVFSKQYQSLLKNIYNITS